MCLLYDYYDDDVENKAMQAPRSHSASVFSLINHFGIHFHANRMPFLCLNGGPIGSVAAQRNAP